MLKLVHVVLFEQNMPLPSNRNWETGYHDTKRLVSWGAGLRSIAYPSKILAFIDGDHERKVHWLLETKTISRNRSWDKAISLETGVADVCT